MVKRIITSTVVAAALGAVGYWLLHTPPDPRLLALGEWKEVSSRTYVDVTPGKATARGMMHGSVYYEWLQTEKEPYLLRFTYRQEAYEARVTFPDEDRALVEPQVWDRLPAEQKKMLRDINRAHNRPEEELRFYFRRVKDKQR